MDRAAPEEMQSTKLTEYQLFVFDLDNTLCESKQPIPTRMAKLLLNLLAYKPVAVISGGAFKQFQVQILQPLEKNLLSKINKDEPNSELEVFGQQLAGIWNNLHLLPACGTSYWRWKINTGLEIGQKIGSWKEIYHREFDQSSKEKIRIAVKEVTQDLAKEIQIDQIWGVQLEDRGQQFTWSALGQLAPLEKKMNWDPEGRKRRAVQVAIAKRLGSEFSVQVGGSTSVDIMAAGIDKGFALQAIMANLPKVDVKQVIFWGDQLAPGGNDYPVALLGFPCVKVSSWQDCANQLEILLNRLSDILKFEVV